MQAVPAQMQAPGEARPVGMQMQPMVINGAAPQAMMMSPLATLVKSANADKRLPILAGSFAAVSTPIFTGK